MKVLQNDLAGSNGPTYDDEGHPLSATNSARMGITQTYIYL
jgi:hypothetical protein